MGTKHLSNLIGVCDFLDIGFSGRWIGRGGPITWPPRSPELTPLDFFFWGFLNDQVYVLPLPANPNELLNQITAAAALVTPDMLQRVWEEIDFKMDVYCMTNGNHMKPS